MGEREIDLKEALKEQGDATKPLGPSGNKGYERKDSILRRLQAKLLSGAIHISVVQEKLMRAWKRKVEGSFDEP